MRKVELVVPEQDIVPVTEALAASGLFHLVPTEYFGDENVVGTGNKWHTWAITFTTLERRILMVMEALHVDAGSPPDAPHLIEPDVAQRDIEHLEKEIQAPLHKLEASQRRLTQLERYLTQLEPIADLEVDLSTIRNMRYTYVMLGLMPTANIERLRSSLEHIPYSLVQLRREEHLTAVVLFGLQRDAQILDRAARSAYINPLNPPETYRGTPAEAISALHAGIERTRQHIAEDQVELEYLQEIHARLLQHLLWRVRASRKLVETIARYGRLRYTYLIAGWTPASKVPLLQHQLETVSENITIEISPPKREREGNGEGRVQDQVIPVALDNPAFFRAFQGLVTNYGYPNYGELDPVTIVALTFPLIFGIMFGDVGHGLLLTLVGALLLSRKVSALKSLANMGFVVVACGMMATICGFLYGSIFGFENVLPALWLRPLEDIMDILIITGGVGASLLSLGMIYNIVNAALNKKWGHMIFNRNGLVGLAFYWSLLGLAISIFIPNFPIKTATFATATVLLGAAVTFSEVLARLVEGQRPLVEESWGSYLMEAAFELFETVIGLLSNTLSYVRMGAFAVAHGALSLVVFIIAEMVGSPHSLGYWLVVILGNLFVIGFEGMIVGIQTLRLEYYEFFSKFFSGGGLCYTPMSLVSKESNEA